MSDGINVKNKIKGYQKETFNNSEKTSSSIVTDPS